VARASRRESEFGALRVSYTYKNVSGISISRSRKEGRKIGVVH